MRFLAGLTGLMLTVCGCSQQAQQFVVQYPNQRAANDPLAMRKTSSVLVPVSHVTRATLPPVAEEGKAQAMQKLIGLDVAAKPSFAGPFRALTAEECRCRAVEASS